MELAKDELQNFILIWISAIISLTYSFAVAKTAAPGATRLVLILPVVSLFLVLPLRLTSIHLTGATAFFLTWLANFKLLLLAAGHGPLSPHLSLPYFIALASLPIKSNHHHHHHLTQYTATDHASVNYVSKDRRVVSDETINSRDVDEKPRNMPAFCSPNSKNFMKSGHKPQIHTVPFFSYFLKATLLASFIKVYDFTHQIHPTLLHMIYFFHIYFMLELMLAIIAAIANFFLGLELEPQFNEPLLSSSLQDFWGRRWNLMVTGILRPTVYDPVKKISERLVGRRTAALVAVFATFLVSGAMHELIFYYLGRAPPTFEVSVFFVLHGAGVCVEIAAKRAVGGAWRPPRAVATAATAAVVIGTGLWLFLPPMMRFRLDERAFEEYATVGAFVRKVTGI